MPQWSEHFWSRRSCASPVMRTGGPRLGCEKFISESVCKKGSGLHESKIGRSHWQTISGRVNPADNNHGGLRKHDRALSEELARTKTPAHEIVLSTTDLWSRFCRDNSGTIFMTIDTATDIEAMDFQEAPAVWVIKNYR